MRKASKEFQQSVRDLHKLHKAQHRDEEILAWKAVWNPVTASVLRHPDLWKDLREYVYAKQTLNSTTAMAKFFAVGTAITMTVLTLGLKHKSAKALLKETFKDVDRNALKATIRQYENANAPISLRALMTSRKEPTVWQRLDQMTELKKELDVRWGDINQQSEKISQTIARVLGIEIEQARLHLWDKKTINATYAGLKTEDRNSNNNGPGRGNFLTSLTRPSATPRLA